MKRLGPSSIAIRKRRGPASALIGLGVGSALVPSGRDCSPTDGVPFARDGYRGRTRSAQLVSVPLQLIPTRMDQYPRRIHRQACKRRERESHDPQGDRERWRDAADPATAGGSWWGRTLFVAGTANLATVYLTLLLAPAGAFGMSRKTQYTWGGVMMGIGVPVITVSVRFLLEWSLEETSWEAYRTMKSDAGMPGAPPFGSALNRRRANGRRRRGLRQMRF